MAQPLVSMLDDDRLSSKDERSSSLEVPPATANSRDRWGAAAAPLALDSPEGLAGLRGAVADLLAVADRHAGPLERALVHTAVIRELHALVTDVAAERDSALRQLLLDAPATTSRRLAPLLGVSRQRVDQLRAHVSRGGRSRRPSGGKEPEPAAVQEPETLGRS
jgi:hypothetical protein